VYGAMAKIAAMRKWKYVFKATVAIKTALRRVE